MSSNGNQLTLPASGGRNYSNGSLSQRGAAGYYWSSTDNYRVIFISSASNGATVNGAPGLSVRCISE
ncbi:hypothetical protein D1631_00360 [Chryseobacterium nematophagum]|uniref:Fibrobacter succinogenes major paralogous domain-containing protein n=1 Tax=Chryseobacterium nematophagum TaxID=2305228 RepID=A0A3M7TMY3_9FLAO|nr:hypothetical protein [Chryseobacterium nematophagum]RNA63969.1 hypothetical protein D1631_00215 [Chryseobacterium nematophagum]RNA63993.1 hypothetical protein D1631_00360 [Chryseobacterium nematophagum]